MNEWLEVEHHVHRDPRYRYRTYRLGRKALVFEMHEPTEPLGAGGHSGQGAGGPGRPSDSGTAPKGALSLEETTTKSEPDPESSSSFLVSLDPEEPQIPEAPVVQIPEASLAEIPEPEASPIPEPTSTPTAVETPTPPAIAPRPAAQAVDLALLAVRLMSLLTSWTEAMATAKIGEWICVHGLEKVKLVLTLGENLKQTARAFKTDGGFGFHLTRWDKLRMPLAVIREEVSATEPRPKPGTVGSLPVMQNLNAPAPIEPDPDPAATEATLSGGWRSWGRAAP